MSLPSGTGRGRGYYKLHFTSGYVNDLAYAWDDVNAAWVALDNACIPMGAKGFAAGTIVLPTGWTAGDLAAQMAMFPTDDFGAFTLDETNGYINEALAANMLIDGVAADGHYPLPLNWFGAPYIKLHSLAAGAGSNQAQTDKDVIVFLIG